MTGNQVVKQVTVVPQESAKPGQANTYMSLFNEAGEPLEVLTEAPTGANVLLTGYAAGAGGTVAAEDTVNVAVRKIVANLAAGDVAQTGANVLLTGYASGSPGAVAAADTVNAAIAKLEARIAALEA